jgi:hypothetical protein
VTETLAETETTEPEPEPEPVEPLTEEEQDAADEQEQETEQEPEDAAPQPGPATQDDYEQVFDKAVKRAKTYMNAVPTILGESGADLAHCPRCTDFLPGFILPLAIKPVLPDQAAAVKISLGEGAPVEYRQADDAQACGKCGGHGKVATGSHVPRHTEVTCPVCHGKGWTGSLVAPAATAPETPAYVPVDGELPPPEPQPQSDPWGRVKGDPLYGVMPGFEPE